MRITDDFWKYSIEVMFGIDMPGRIDSFDVNDEVKEYLMGLDWDGAVTCGRSIVIGAGDIFMWISDPMDTDTIAHEALHVTRHILHNVQGIPLTDDTEEVYALMVGSITGKVTRYAGEMANLS